MNIEDRLESLGFQLLFSTIRIEAKIKNQDNYKVGTGFIVSKNYNGKRIDYLVTNNHVIENTEKGYLTFTKKDTNENPLVGKTFTLEIENDFEGGFEDIWFKHQGNVDLCTTPLIPALALAGENGGKLFYKPIEEKYFANQGKLEELYTFQQIGFLGYPNDLFDRKNYLPIFRSGITATPPDIDYDGKPLFIIDASVFGGSSGSPVFVCDEGVHNVRNSMVMSSRFILLGILSSVYCINKEGVIVKKSIPTIEGKTKFKLDYEINLGIVIKIKELNEGSPRLKPLGYPLWMAGKVV